MNWLNRPRKTNKYQLGGKNEYIVQKGDTLSSISQKFTGKASNFADFAEINKITDPNKIQEGQKLYIPKKFKDPLKLAQIPTQNKVAVVDNYSPNFNYIVEGDKVYYSKKGQDHWVDISDNDVARKNLYTFLGSKYNFRGYEDNESKIRDRIEQGTFNYSNYRDSLNNVDVTPVTSVAASNIPRNKVQVPTLSYSHKPIIAQRSSTSFSIPQTKSVEARVPLADNKLSRTIEMVKNGIDRKLLKAQKETTDPVSNMSSQEISIDSKYGIRPSHFTGDTVWYSSITPKGIPGRYYLPESLDLSDMTFGVRNRGDKEPLNTEGGVVTSTHAFLPKSKYTDPNRTYMGVDSSGKFKVGKYTDFVDQDMIAPTFVNRIKDFDLNEDGSFNFAHGKHGNNKPSPSVIVIDDSGKEIKGSLNLITWGNKGDSKKYGNLTGGRLVAKAGNETRLLSGSIENIKAEMDNLKKRNNSEFVDVYTLDNGSYNLGLRTKNKTIDAHQQQRYDALNAGGGHFLYIKDKAYNIFPSDTILTPNVRTEQSESFKKGHGLVNERKGALLHHTAFTGEDLNPVVNYLTKPGNNSAHVVIGYKGERKVLAPPEKVTFHAGESMWNNRDNVNNFMVGLEFQGDTNNKRLTDQQIESAIEYLAPIIRENKISLENITTHKHVRDLYNQYSKKKAPNKTDLNEMDYTKIIEALKNKVYYKYKEGGKFSFEKYMLKKSFKHGLIKKI